MAEVAALLVTGVELSEADSEVPHAERTTAQIPAAPTVRHLDRLLFTDPLVSVMPTSNQTDRS
ncbi:hypothetical protein ACFWMS_28195 [Peribacillus butanolivorans]|uniref:hypothetical protein n=1 Tax=Peribacillus butanolivorans TaxID=421767 RepID=UPI003651A9F5